MKSRELPKIAVFCSGYGSNFQALLDAVRKKKLAASISLMVCDKPGAFAITRAKRAGIPVVVLPPRFFKSREAYERVIVGILKQEGIRLVVLAGFMRIFSSYFIRSFKNIIVNIHPSYLPAFKGAHSIKDAFDAGVRQTGVTVHLVTLKIDSGRILTQQKVEISKKDTLAVLEKRIHAVEHQLYPKAIGLYLKSLYN